MNAINPCPKCHSPRLWTVKLHPGFGVFTKYFVECRFCHCCGPARMGKKRAVKAWNKHTETFAGELSSKATVASMSRDEIVAYMNDNHFVKVKHELFASNEFLYMADDGFIYDENDYLFENWEFDGPDGIRYRQGAQWQRGWSLFNEKKDRG